MRRLIVVPMLVALVSCQPGSPELTDARKAEITAEVSARNAEFLDAWRAADWDRGMSYYLDSPDFVWAAGGAVFFGIGMLQEARPGFDNVRSQTFTFRDTRATVMAPNAASVTALGTWAQTDTTGVTGPARDFAWTSVWLLHGGEWKIHLVHMSYPVPAPRAM